MYRCVCMLAAMGIWVTGCGASGATTVDEEAPTKSTVKPVGGETKQLNGLGGSFISNREASSTPPKCDMAAPRQAATFKTCIVAQQEAVRGCYVDALDIDDTIAGVVRVKLMVGPNGDVEQVTLAKTTVAAGGLERCVMNAVGKWLFPSGSGRLQFEYPFKFRATEE